MTSSYLTGIRLMIQAAVAFSLMAVCVKTASRDLPSIEIVFFRSIIGFLLTLFFIRINKVPYFGTQKKQMIIRGVCGFFALHFFFYSLANLPLGTAVLLNYTSPFFVLLLSPVILKEKVPAWLFSLVILCFAGLWLLTTGEIDYRSKYFAAALASSAFAAVSYITIRAVKGKESPFTIMFYFTLISSVASAFFTVPVYQHPSPQGWITLVGAGLWAFAGQYFLTHAIHHAPPSLVSPFSYLTPVLAYFYGLIFWDETLSARGFCGVLLIIFGGCLISYFSGKMHRQSIMAPPEEESV